MKAGLTTIIAGVGLCLCGIAEARAQVSTNSFFNFETAPVHPVAVSPDGSKLAVCDLPEGHLEIFDITSGAPVSMASIPVGIDPVSVRFRTPTEIWVANYISSSISVIDLASLRVFNTITTSNQPSDIVFAGNPQQAYVSCGLPNLVEVFNPFTDLWVINVAIDGNRPRAMDVSPDGSKVYVAIFESGNASTIISSDIAQLGNLPKPSTVNFPAAPSKGLNPPPNNSTNFVPAINPNLGTNTPPKVGLIVKKNSSGHWMDDNNGDWTSYITGTNAAFTGRIPGWDMPDHDLAVINTTNLSVNYACGLMNICMAVGVNPATGKISVVGTDALNSIRFQPVLESIFIRVNVAQVDPSALTGTISDLNPHLNYLSQQVSSNLVAMSIGDPRGIIWSSDGSTAYVTGMGSDNVVLINALGDRAGANSVINVGQGPTGLALDESRHRLYVYNRFGGSVSTIDTVAQSVLSTTPLFDPTPQVIKAGRPFLYNTHLTSGLGQLACASCHVDARFDRLAWDLGDPTSTMGIVDSTFNFSSLTTLPKNNFHPMKGPMVTLTLQNIIGHEPFHWRGDREGIEAFSPTFTELQGMPGTGITSGQMAQLKAFLATIGFGPNPYRPIDNSLSTSLAIPGQLSLGRGVLPVGAQLPNGNAQNGQTTFRSTTTSFVCIVCHTLPAGLGTDSQFIGGSWHQLAVSTNNSHHSAIIQLPRSSNLPFKIPSLRNLPDKIGMNLSSTNSRAGFGFFNDGSVDGLVRFLQDGFAITNDQQTSDLVAFLYSVTGSDLIPGSLTDANRSPGLSGLDTQAGVGRQVTINATTDVPLIDTMITLAGTSTNRVDLIVKGMKNGIARGWFYTNGTFLSDRHGETYSPLALRSLAAPGSEQTYMLVPKGSGMRLGIDRDLDGNYDGDLLVQSFNANSNGATIGWPSVIGLSYQVQYKNHLTDSGWTTLPGSVSGTGNPVFLTDNAPGTNTARYYRVTTIQQ